MFPIAVIDKIDDLFVALQHDIFESIVPLKTAYFTIRTSLLTDSLTSMII